MSVLNALLGNYADDIARAAANKLDDAARVAANKLDDAARVAANKADDMVTLFHNTKADNIPSILENGLIPGQKPDGYLVSPEEAGIWTDTRGLDSGSYGGTTVKIRIPRKEFEATRVNDTQNLLNRVIKPSEIEGVNYMLFDTPLIKNSNLKDYVDKYGEEKVRKLIERKGIVPQDVIDNAFIELKNKAALPKTPNGGNGSIINSLLG